MMRYYKDRLRLGAAIALLFGLASLVSPQSPLHRTASQIQQFTFHTGQSVYVVAAGDRLELTRRATDEFKAQKKFKIANSVNQADFVFIIISDEESQDFDEAAFVVLADDYKNSAGNLDEIHAKSIWQSTGHANYVMKTLWPLSSVSRNLVKQFHKEVFNNKKEKP